MATDTWQILQAWVLSALVYPGVVFGVALALLGEWLFASVRPSLTPRVYRTTHLGYVVLSPVYKFLKLAGRREGHGAAISILDSARTARPQQALGLVSALAPLLALAILPFPGSPIESRLGHVGDLLLLLVLLAVGPACAAMFRANTGGLETQAAGQDIGRLVTGLFPILLSVAALTEASGSFTTRVAALTAAPETATQFLVRVLAGVALLVALPWWSVRETPGRSASTYAGRLFQRAALAAFWAVIVLPAPGDPVWAFIVAAGGALFAYVAMRAVEQRWAPAMRPEEAARRVWLTSVPVAAIAMLVAIVWAGA